jgi:hypothetical protein
MLMNVYTGISESLRRLSVQVKVLLDIASGLGNHPSREHADYEQGLMTSPAGSADDRHVLIMTP